MASTTTTSEVVVAVSTAKQNGNTILTTNGTTTQSSSSNNNNNNDNNDSSSSLSLSSSFGPNVHISIHPVLFHKITILRSSSTLPSSFRAVLREVTFHLGYEATKSLTTRPVAITVPLAAAAATATAAATTTTTNHQQPQPPPSSTSSSSSSRNQTNNNVTTTTTTTFADDDHYECTGHKLVERIALIPILRSGLGMVDSMLELLPNAAIYHIGMYRSKIVSGGSSSSSFPIQYFNRLPRTCHAHVAYVLDPVIATASTILSVVAILKKWGVPKIHVVSVLASRAGLRELMDTHPDICVTIGTIDDELREDGTLVPGLGDSGDRLFGTPLLEDDDDSALLHISKRKRINSEG